MAVTTVGAALESVQPRRVHVINPLQDAAGGSERRALELCRVLREAVDVYLWSPSDPDSRLEQDVAINLLRPAAGRFPRRGTFVFIGDYHPPVQWIAHASPTRTILVYNTCSPRRLQSTLDCLSVGRSRTLEIVYASRMLQSMTPLPGPVEYSLIDLRRFAPRPVTARPFTVGRLSRDWAPKHHPDDPALYRRLLSEGFHLRLMGATCLAPELEPHPALELLPANALPAEDFLAGIDCFYYRTAPQWLEAWGRVVMEAMACGLPVVCDRRGGYCDIIENGINGFVVDDEAGVVASMRQLHDDPPLRARIGAAARATMERIYGPAARARIRDFYLR